MSDDRTLHDILSGIRELQLDRDREFDEWPTHVVAAHGLKAAVSGVPLSDEQQDALIPYLELFTELLINPRFRRRLNLMKSLIDKQKNNSNEIEDEFKPEIDDTKIITPDIDSIDEYDRDPFINLDGGLDSIK